MKKVFSFIKKHPETLLIVVLALAALLLINSFA